MLNKKVIGFIGAGNMAEALVKGLLSSRAVKASQIIVSDRDKKKTASFNRIYRVRAVKNNTEVVRVCDILILAVKPVHIKDVVREIAPLLKVRQTVISIAAGTPTASIEKLLKAGVPVIRVMPNAPALIGKGMAVVSRGRYATQSHAQRVLELFRSVGKAILLPEKYMDAVTAVSGSGPAYLFYLLESMAEAGQKAGLPKAAALSLAAETLSGAAQMAGCPGADPVQLRERVTSKGGTTQAALAVLKKKHYKRSLILAVLAASRRSRQISRSS